MIRRGLENSIESAEWLSENYERLKREYNNKWVLIEDKKVVESKDTFDQILQAARKYKSNSVILEYISSEDVAMFF